MHTKQKPRVLISDDDVDLLSLMATNLSNEGFDVQLSPNADDIYDIISTNPPDIILLDITMQGINGRDICKTVKSLSFTRQIPVIIFSGVDNIEEITRECGAEDFIKKPFDTKLMQEKLWHALSEKIN